MGRQLSCKKFILLICKILRLFLNTFSAVGKYSLLNRYNITQPIQMQLCQKKNPFLNIFSAYFKSSLNFEHFGKKDDPHSLFTSELTASEKRG